MIEEARFVCPNPKCETPAVRRLPAAKFDIHHLDEMRDNNARENLLALCKNCHQQATDHVLSVADLDLWKRMLVSRVHPRRGPETAADLVKPVKKIRVKKITFNATGNLGPVQQAETIHNTRISYGAKTKSPIILPGSIATDPRRYSYMEYLIKRLSDWRKKGERVGQKRTGKVHPGIIRSQIEHEWHGLPKDLPLEKWEPLCKWLKAKTDATALGRVNRKKSIRNYHTFEEHG
jgi:hypothetical protein